MTLDELRHLLSRDVLADRVVPPSGTLARLTLFSAATMAFLAVFALALSLAAGRMAASWSQGLAQSATVRLSAPEAEIAAQTAAVLEHLSQSPGITQVRALSAADQQDLLAPWFGPDLPVDSLPLPQLIEVSHDGTLQGAALQAELQQIAPDAVLDDHTRWRAPLVRAAGGLRALAWASILLIALTMAAMIALSARASLAANTQVIAVLRQIGARDSEIARVFIRTTTMRAALGAAIGTGLGMLLLWLAPAADRVEGLISGLGLGPLGSGLALCVPVYAAVVALFATRAAALAALRRIP